MTKKRFFPGILCLLLLLAASACQVTDPAPSQPGGFTASLEGVAGTRTSLSGGTAVLWSADDTIRVFKVSDAAPGYTGHDFGIDPACCGQPDAAFSDPGCEDYYTVPCLAFYPASMVAELGSSGLTFSLPAVQEGVEGSFGHAASPALARSQGDGKLAFNNLCGLLAVTVSIAEPVEEVRVTTMAEEALWGTATVDITYDDKPLPVLAAPADPAQKTLTFKVKEGTEPEGQFITAGSSPMVADGTVSGQAPVARTYYLVVPSGSLSQGFVVTVLTRDRKYMQQYAAATESNRILRSYCTRMPEFSFEDASEVKVRTDVPNKSFYKDLFMDSGAGIGKFTTQPFVAYMGLDYEYFFAPRENFTAADLEKQKLAFGGSPEDLNGVLLYPDGEPRFKMIYVNGGYSVDHGRNLFAACRENFNRFFYNGGSYAGSCAGAMLSSRGLVTNAFTSTAGYLGFWPAFCNELSITDIYPTYIFPEDSPLLRYNDFGGDRKVEGVKHWNGPYFRYWFDVPGTEVLCINSLQGYAFDGYPSVIAYKPSIWSGRVIPIGGHPEQGEDEEQLNLMASVVRYAIDGQGVTRAKGVLRNGEVRRMVKSTVDDDPAYTKIGDRQCHHFVFALPDGARNIRVRLESLEDFNLSLFLAGGTFAYEEDAQYSAKGADRVKELSFDTLSKGTWYVGVRCEDVPTMTAGDYGYIYSGNTAVLNGAPYTVQVTWE